MTSSIKTAKKRFTLVLVSFTLITLLTLGFALYETNLIKFSEDVSSNELHSLVEDSPAVVEYLEEEKDYEAHFITIANLIRQDQQLSLGRSLVYVGVPIIILSLSAGYLISKRLFKPVEDAYQSQERFIQDAAHELRNPLAAMSATVQAFSTGKLNDKERKLLKTMKRQTVRLVRIAEDLLFLERRGPQENIKEINISELSEDVMEDLKHLTIKKKQKFSASIEKDIHLKIAEKDFILLFRNVLENAIKYTPNSKGISVKLTKQRGRVHLVVEDKGIGIPESEIDMVGERFFRASNTGKYEGNGLGMAIVNKVVNRNAGKVEVISKLNKGTRVDLYF